MSHTVTVKSTKMVDREILLKSLAALGINDARQGVHTMYDGSAHEGLAFKLPGWKYDAIVEADGNCYYDNYRGDWGAQVELDKLIQKYSAEKSAYELAQIGYSVESITEDPQTHEMEIVAKQYATA